MNIPTTTDEAVTSLALGIRFDTNGRREHTYILFADTDTVFTREHEDRRWMHAAFDRDHIWKFALPNNVQHVTVYVRWRMKRMGAAP